MSDHCGSDHQAFHRRRNGEGEGRGERDEERTGGRRTATRADLVDAIAATCPHLPRTEARHVFEAALDEISEALRRGDVVKLRSFGQFTVRAKRERVGRNPRTGVEVAITPRRVLTFRPSSVLIGLVNGAAPDPQA